MPSELLEILNVLRGYSVVWAVAVIAAMAVTAVALYVFWDLVGRGISLVARALNVGQPRRRQ
ncbi:MAG: hypothetical protein OXE87_17975 [Chloroflexi bacterium]|nr:hypothetical protein [Chloroflexota bacterium]